MSKVGEFLSRIYSKDDPESSKRFFGSIGFIACVVVICLWKQNFIDQLLYVSAALIGAGIFDNKFKSK
jgi:hypothetical protein